MARIATTFGIDVVIQGNNDLSRFSEWAQNDPRYQSMLTVSRNATMKAGKFWGNAGEQYLTGNPLSADVRFVQNGPSMDGWMPPARGRGNAEEPAVGAPAGRGAPAAGKPRQLRPLNPVVTLPPGPPPQHHNSPQSLLCSFGPRGLIWTRPIHRSGLSYTFFTHLSSVRVSF